MILMIPKGYDKTEPGAMPDAKAVAAMMKMIIKRFDTKYWSSRSCFGRERRFAEIPENRS
jgi:hypothetical protein